MFNEITVDRRFVKYQSTINSSWYLGFNNAGDAISGHESQTLDETVRSIKRERCYQFEKQPKLRTSAQFFPEVMDLDPNLALDKLNTTALIITKIHGPIVHSFTQKQLINMSRYKNILRYQLHKSRTEPLVANLTNSSSLQIASDSTRPKTTAKRKKTHQKTTANKFLASKGDISTLEGNTGNTTNVIVGGHEPERDLNKLIATNEGKKVGDGDLAIESFSNFSAPASGA